MEAGHANKTLTVGREKFAVQMGSVGKSVKAIKNVSMEHIATAKVHASPTTQITPMAGLQQMGIVQAVLFARRVKLVAHKMVSKRVQVPPIAVQSGLLVLLVLRVKLVPVANAKRANVRAEQRFVRAIVSIHLSTRFTAELVKNSVQTHKVVRSLLAKICLRPAPLGDVPKVPIVT